MATFGTPPMSFTSVSGSAGLGQPLHSRSLCCKCFNTRINLCLGADQCMTCHIVPICKTGSRRARAYQKKFPVKKVLRKHSTPLDAESVAMEGGKDSSEQGVELENGSMLGGIVEPVQNLASSDELQLVVEPESDAFSTNDSSSSSSRATEDESFIKIMEDLMNKVKDAEKNILRLNDVRMQSLEQLEETRRENDTVQAKVNMLQMQLAEADMKLKAASQEKAKTKLLEKEVEVLKTKLSKNIEAMVAMSRLDTDHMELSEHEKTMNSEALHLATLEAEREQLKLENQALQEEISLMQSELAKSSKEVATVVQLKQERDSLQKKIGETGAKLAIAESNALELAKLKLEKQVALENLQKLDIASPSPEMDLQLKASKKLAENGALQDKVNKLEAMLSKLEKENKVLQGARGENEGLKSQIKLLEKKLVESDAEIRSQLESYQAEVESLEASLEQLEVEKEAKADDMPWEFWSHVLLFIDGWLLEKKLSFGDASALREMAWRRDASIRDVFGAKKGQLESDIMAGLLELLRNKKRPGVHIIHIAAEMAPVAKVGGLGDVVTGLGKALQRRDQLVEVVVPKYDCMDYSRINNLRVLDMDLNSYFDGYSFKNKVWVGTVEGLPVYFIEPHHPAKFFWRGKVYGEMDDFKRFTYFSRAALEFVLQAGKRPDIIHCHDWHTAAVAPMYWSLYVPQGLDSARIAFTCHNFEYQGTDSPEALASCGLDPQQLHRPDRMQDNFIHNRVNLLKGAIVFSNIVTTVSPTYAQEVQLAEGGKGLHLTLMAQSHKFFGILNGIDAEAWNPASDLLISYQYSADDIDGKAANKAALRSTLRLSGTPLDSNRPIVGCITRLVPQKGVHLIRHAIFRTLELGGQFVLLGSSPVDNIQREFEALAQQFSQHPHVRLILKYDEALSHSIYAGADIFIIPSIFEPCGLTQMISMRYGAIPVARRTGGLNDSVFDIDDEMIPVQTRNGFTFSGVHEKDLNHALDRAIKYFVQRKEWWQDLVRRAMLMDFSWNSSAQQYEELYERAIARARGTT